MARRNDNAPSSAGSHGYVLNLSLHGQSEMIQYRSKVSVHERWNNANKSSMSTRVERRLFWHFCKYEHHQQTAAHGISNKSYNPPFPNPIRSATLGAKYRGIFIVTKNTGSYFVDWIMLHVAKVLSRSDTVDEGVNPASGSA